MRNTASKLGKLVAFVLVIIFATIMLSESLLFAGQNNFKKYSTAHKAFSRYVTKATKWLTKSILIDNEEPINASGKASLLQDKNTGSVTVNSVWSGWWFPADTTNNDNDNDNDLNQSNNILK